MRFSDEEIRFEVVVTDANKDRVLRAMLTAHPYEEVAYELVKIENAHQEVGAGLIGVLPEALGVDDFLQFLKNKMELSFVKFTKIKYLFLYKARLINKIMYSSIIYQIYTIPAICPYVL